MNLYNRVKLASGVVRSSEAAETAAAALHASKVGGVWYAPVSGGEERMTFTNGDGPVSAMEISAAYRCVMLLSQSIAALPLRPLKLRQGVMQPDEGSALWELLTVEPCPRFSAYDFIKLAVRRMILDGVVYVIPRRDTTGRIYRLDLAFTSQVAYDAASGRYTVSQTATEPSLRLQGLGEEEIIVLRYQTPDGLTCAGAATYGHRAVELARAAEDETMARIADGGAPRLLLNAQSTAVGVGGPVEDSLREAAKAIDYQNKRNRSRIIVAPTGTSATQIGATSADLQLQAVREFAVRDICRAFGVPPMFVFSDSTSNYKSVEAASTDFLVNTLDPIMRGIEGELLRKLVPAGRRGKVRFEFDRAARSASDPESRARYMAQMLASGAFTVNEVRSRIGMPAVEGGDTSLVSANLRPVADVSQGEPDDNDNDKKIK